MPQGYGVYPIQFSLRIFKHSMPPISSSSSNFVYFCMMPEKLFLSINFKNNVMNEIFRVWNKNCPRASK